MKRIGIVGIGAISGIYLENITHLFRDIEIIGVCDLIRERAENAQKKYNIPKLYENMHEEILWFSMTTGSMKSCMSCLRIRTSISCST